LIIGLISGILYNSNIRNEKLAFSKIYSKYL
jgi:hypothetical protein